MRVYPAMTTKRLGEAEPGELIRLQTWDTADDATALGFVAISGDRRFTVYFSGAAGIPGPLCMEESQPEERVVSYGRDFVIEIASSESAAFARSGLWGRLGALALAEDRLVLRARPHSGGRRLWIDLSSGALVNEPLEGSCFSAWSIGVPMPGNRLLTLLNFEVR